MEPRNITNITREKDGLQTLYTFTHTFVIPSISFWGLLGSLNCTYCNICTYYILDLLVKPILSGNIGCLSILRKFTHLSTTFKFTLSLLVITWSSRGMIFYQQ